MFDAESDHLSAFKFSWWAPKDACLCNRVRNDRNGRSRSSTVVDFATNEKDVCDFLLVIDSNLGTILHRF